MSPPRETFDLVTWWRRHSRGRALGAFGVLAAGLLLAEANFFAARHFTRVDFTTDRAFTLSPPTLALLHDLDEPVEIVSLLPKADPLAVEARHLLDAYRAESSQIRVSFVDPSRDLAAFAALGKEHDLAAEPGEPGTTLAEAAFLIRRKDQSWFIHGHDLVRQDEAGRAQMRLEALLSEGIARVERRERLRVCFLTGHGERSLDDAGNEGLNELDRRLEKSNLETERVPLDVPRPEQALRSCSVIALMGPERPLPREHVDALLAAWRDGANFALFVDPIVDGQGRFGDVGITRLLDVWQLSFDVGFVIETDPKRRLPRGIGEAFFTDVATHPLTRGLSTDEARLDARPVAVGTQSIQAASTSRALPLVRSSAASFLLNDLSRTTPPSEKDRGARVLGVALDDPRPSSALAPPSSLDASSAESKRTRAEHHRAVVFGSSAWAGGDSFRDPALYGNRVLVENAFSWLTDRPALVAVPDRPSRSAGLVVTEESLGELFRYVVLYMPITAGLLGTFFLLRRRSREAQSRDARAKEGT